jgi:hypothetical protein
MEHSANPVVQTLSELNLVSKIEFLMASMYNYCFYNLKWVFKANKVAEIMQTKGTRLRS